MKQFHVSEVIKTAVRCKPRYRGEPTEKELGEFISQIESSPEVHLVDRNRDKFVDWLGASMIAFYDQVDARIEREQGGHA